MVNGFRLSSALAAFCCVFQPLQVQAFERTVPDKAPSEYHYGAIGPTYPSFKTAQLEKAFVSSIWYANFLSGDNGHDYFIIANHANSKGYTLQSFISFLDITTGKYWGRSIFSVGTMPTEKYEADFGGFRLYSPTEDAWSVQGAESRIPGAEFNLTYVPKGPNLYDGGSGTYYSHNGYVHQFAAPEMWVEGYVIDENDSVVNVIPEKSFTWLDRQWGDGFSADGWSLFMLHFSNGIKGCIWNIWPGKHHPRQVFGSFSYPDGHQEVVSVVEDFHGQDPWISETTGVTYFARYRVEIPEKDSTLTIVLPVLAGEMVPEENPGADNSLLEAFATLTGTFGGEEVDGYAIVEQKQGLDYVDNLSNVYEKDQQAL